MAYEKFRAVRKYFPVLLGTLFHGFYRRTQAFVHRFTYKLLPETQNVVVIGGSFAGGVLSRSLAESLPSGFRVILVERNSHFNFTFNFPRYSVVSGREHKAFVPYNGLRGNNAPKGIFEQIQDIAVGFTEKEVHLKSGKSIPFKYLAIATGVKQSPPAKLLSRQKDEACHELQVLQLRIQQSKSIAIVGAGPVGVQLASDIKTFYPEKHVTLIHSREQLLPTFGRRLHVYVLDKLHKMGVETILGERPTIPKMSNWDKTEVTFKDNGKRTYELVIPCTGQTPNSSLLEAISPSSISTQNHRILVHPSLQIQQHKKIDGSPDLRNVFALGDVAETGGPKMARAGLFQAEVVRSNIIRLIAGRRLKEYKPMAMEGALKLTLGKVNILFCSICSATRLLIKGAIRTTWKVNGNTGRNSDSVDYAIFY
ncbi:hypothetical protein HYFRA_00012783, partial [Hymenoscyphus fraxineus]